jgi:hypothetical protein
MATSPAERLYTLARSSGLRNLPPLARYFNRVATFLGERPISSHPFSSNVFGSKWKGLMVVAPPFEDAPDDWRCDGLVPVDRSGTVGQGLSTGGVG